MSKFNRIPNRTEKEPMRHLYMYYKRLKQYIQRKQQIQGSALGASKADGPKNNGYVSGGSAQSRSSSVGSQGSHFSANLSIDSVN